MTMSPRRKFGDEHLVDLGLEGLAVDRPVEHHGRDDAAARSPATKVVVFQWPCGTAARRRSPRRRGRGARHLVDAQVSSMKTSRVRIEVGLIFEPSPPRSGRQGGPARRRAPTFFARDAVTLEEATDRAVAERVPLFAEAVAQFFDRRVPVASSNARIFAGWALIRPDLRSPPRALG